MAITDVRQMVLKAQTSGQKVYLVTLTDEGAGELEQTLTAYAFAYTPLEAGLLADRMLVLLGDSTYISVKSVVAVQGYGFSNHGAI